MKLRAVFLDRDGVINDMIFHGDVGIPDSPATPRQFRLKPGVARAIRDVNRLGFKTIVISNQPGVATGRFSTQTLFRVTSKMIRDLERRNAHLDGIYYCLHHPLKGRGKLGRRCLCRKPKPGLLLEAARDYNLNLKKSYMIGDTIYDVQAGRRAGCTTFLLAHLKCDLCDLLARRGVRPHYFAKDLLAAVRAIKRFEKGRA